MKYLFSILKDKNYLKIDYAFWDHQLNMIVANLTHVCVQVRRMVKRMSSTQESVMVSNAALTRMIWLPQRHKMDLVAREPVFRVSDKASLKPFSSATEIEISPVLSLHIILSIKRMAKALISLRGCAGWSAPVLFANPWRQVFSRCGPNMVMWEHYISFCRTLLFHRSHRLKVSFVDYWLSVVRRQQWLQVAPLKLYLLAGFARTVQERFLYCPFL